MILDELIESFRRGESQAIQFIFEEYGAYCVDNLKLRTHCTLEEAKDVFIEAILNFRDKVMANKVTISTEANLRNYLYTTCVNMQLSEKRKQYRLLNHKEAIKYHFYETIEEEPFDLDYNDEQGKDLIDICYETLNELGDKCRELLRYFYIQRLSITQVTTKLGFANQNVAKTAKSRCMKKWREAIAQHEPNMNVE
ncbi:MAG: RNA polymerase sigma factor [Flammeovirgaceae bacterium]